MKSDPYKSPVVSYSQGPFTPERAADAPTSEARRPDMFYWRGEEFHPDKLPWELWKKMRREFGHAPGWVFCRFCVRVAEGHGPRGVHPLGIVKGSFGIFSETFEIAPSGSKLGDGEPKIMRVLVHLASGTGQSIFYDDDSAIAAAETIQRMAVDWDSFEDGIPREISLRIESEMRLIGMERPEDAVCRNRTGGPDMWFWVLPVQAQGASS